MSRLWLWWVDVWIMTSGLDMSTFGENRSPLAIFRLCNKQATYANSVHVEAQEGAGITSSSFQKRAKTVFQIRRKAVVLAAETAAKQACGLLNQPLFPPGCDESFLGNMVLETLQDAR